ncbi:3-dehydroquinate synthase [Anoxybacillus sp. J5B_2022]|uniref:3-dehydroquinate synthase n=1 Tax=Anoxybacillus sp. J5B_2022 TaxID=3003246 RepID=UPI0022867143|nr:3-dehydroquinate synthase [Anoxybacillus sp. J5B_2022]MCZ0754442.1 3-dehydroquinate synthase [Anoxybacillus sp. J5B_2022]
MMERITIQTATKQYPLFLGEGMTERLPQLLEELGFAHGTKLLVITDETLEKLYLSEFMMSLRRYYDVYTHIIPSGETAKSFEHYYACQTAALAYGLDRDSFIIAFGGGVVGDLAGFVAATFMRGIAYVQMPTTLLAHDSAVGGKVAINHPLGKNMIGAFHQPEAVIYDIRFLQSLPERELRSGFAEVIKHALIGDRPFYEWLKQNIHRLEDIEGKALQYCIRKGIEVKARIVLEDEKEKGVRAHLNFGHTLAHALESELGYGTITHGDAVALGMLFAIFVSERMYGVSFAKERFTSWFQSYGFPVALSKQLAPERLLQKMKGDKKAKAGQIRMVLLKEIGHVQVETIADEQLLAWLYEFSQSEGERHD